MDVTIRLAETKDLPRIQELSLKLSKKEHKEYDPLLDLDKIEKDDPKHYKNRIEKDDGCVFVAIIDGKIIGYICGGLAKKGSFGRLPNIIVTEIQTFFILEKYRSSGTGKKLYDKFLEWSKRKNADKIRLDVHPQNELAIKFYRKNNFKDYYLTLESDL
jgi:ribosomal protein S18 acetylase RimI-like enzyme